MMKPLTAILPIAAAMLLSCAESNSDSTSGNTFDIALSGKGCNNLMARLYRDTDSGLAIVDSTRFEMQKGRLKGSLQHPELMYLYIDNAPDYLPVFVENSHIDIEINYSKPSKCVVSGSESNKIFSDFLQSYKVYSYKESGNQKMLQSAYSNFDTVMIERLEDERRQIKREAEGLQRQFIQKYIHHPIACYILSAHLMYDMPHTMLRQLADSIPPENRDNIYYRRIINHLNTPDTSMPDLSAHPARQEYEKISTKLRALPDIESRIVEAAQNLLGRPYVGGTLDEGDEETVVIDLKRFDCVTFQETCLALAKDAGSAEPSFENFYRQLEDLRYHDGRNTGYCSRLHYSTDWIADNTLRGNITDITKNIGGVVLPNQIDFMSTHSHLYKHLNGNAAATDSIRAREQWLNDHHTYYIPKSQIAAVADKIPSGSLIFITTSTPGLDFAHVGIAVRDSKGALRMYHASSTDHKTTISPTPLAQYLMGIKKFTGIAVAMPQ
ncbi:MAG: DUF1460 domain-containing protein [Bacteroidales bacterium]|nr:DUF1460 domain-containing protein [Bacteroidales bacterium]